MYRTPHAKFFSAGPVLLLALSAALSVGRSAAAQGTCGCAPDAVQVGPVCVDKYEASVWQIDPSNTALVQKVQAGTATLTDLSAATQLSPAGTLTCPASPYPATFPPDGNWTPVSGSSPPSPGVYAVSVAGVLPSACITWFQAAQACALSGKRLLRNEEWQRAASGTPDPGTDNGTSDCNISTAGGPVNTGSRSNCKSNWGAFDMVGNVDEWVADWVPQSTACPGWGSFSDDQMCLGGASTTNTSASDPGPGALLRGGSWTDGALAGVLFVDGTRSPAASSVFLRTVGFRCAR